VTGAAGDIGRAVAARAVAEGARVVLADLPTVVEGVAATAAACRAARSGVEDVEVVEVAFDVTDAGDVRDVVRGLAEQGVVADAVFNNAGVQGAFADVVSYPLDDLRRVIEINVIGVFHVLQACAAAMIEGAVGDGPPADRSIVSSASMAGVSGAPNMPGYSASKAAVVGLTKSAAKDLAPHGIRVNAVSPAFIGPGAMWDRQTELQAAVPSPYYADDPAAVAEQMIGQIPLRRVGTLDEVAATVVFLLSAEASYLTGINVEIAGGVG
jgi:NAD(P)-dependent dehydrogenase (short-subunit alcohol dehydrogenase family)